MNVKQELRNLQTYVEGQIDDLILKQGYQSRLEIEGLIKREAMKPLRYYGRQYPYATAVSDEVLRINDVYMSTTGWRPSMGKVMKPILDNEFEGIKDEFDMR